MGSNSLEGLNTMNSDQEGSSSRANDADTHSPISIWWGKQRINILHHSLDVSPNGITFSTDKPFAPFTELRVRLRFEHHTPPHSGRTIQCEGVVVECRGDYKRHIHFVTVVFLNLAEFDRKYLARTHQSLLRSRWQSVSPQEERETDKTPWAY